MELNIFYMFPAFKRCPSNETEANKKTFNQSLRCFVYLNARSL